MNAVASAPAAFRVRVWAVMSRGCGPRVGCPPPESVDAAYPPVHKHFLLNSQISVGWPKENRRLSKALDWGFLTEGQCLPFLVSLSDRPGGQTRCQAGTASSTSLPR